MTCRRCEGLMVEEHLRDFQGTYGFSRANGWRCMNCGCVRDSAIEQHRLAQQNKILALPSGEPDYQDEEVHLGVEAFPRFAA